ncbi:ribonuclease P protein subunit p25-like protein [Macrobrachium rosenbergii]|uniref:ribonuclease P protein subunit p25-like protein n=1 Tax=Macrobrachium rosenbergii TaxID=79674 RepID=UPI0034D4F9FD
MENYSKGENVETEAEWNIPVGDTTSRLEVTPSTKIRDAITIALEKLKTENQLLWIGAGPAVSKVVSMAEIVKKRVKGLHQVTQLSYKRVDEYWEPKLEGLDRLKVTREVPAVAILLSKDPLDASVPGYQGPGATGEELWLSKSQAKKKNNSNKNKQRQTFDKNSGPRDNKNQNPKKEKDHKNQNWREGRAKPERIPHQKKDARSEAKTPKGKSENVPENANEP